MIYKAISVILCGAAIGLCSAESVAGIGIRAGYYFGNSFEGLVPGSHRRIEGYEFGADLPLARLPLAEIRLSPTVVFGGATQHGSDTDGTIYRFVLGAKIGAPATPFYGAVGVGFAAAQNRGGRQFDADSGAVAQLTLGYEPTAKLPGLSLYYEVSYTYGSDQLSGLSLAVGAKF